MGTKASLSPRAILTDRFVLAYLALYAVLLGLLYTREGFGLALPLFVLVFIGFGFSAVALLATRGQTAPQFTIKRPQLESAVLIFYLVVVVGGYLVWGMPLLGETFAPGSAAQTIAVLVKKLVLFAIVPFLIFRLLWGYRLRDLADLSLRWKEHLLPALLISLALIPFQMLLGGGMREIRDAGFSAGQLGLGLPLTFLWVLVEVGIVEEIPYRVLLQSRMASLFKSELGGLIVMAVIFGLTHAPGLYFRAGDIEALGGSPSPLLAVGYSIVIVSVVSLFLGFLWIRTKNLLLLMIVHAAFDLIPKMAGTIKAFLPE